MPQQSPWSLMDFSDPKMKLATLGMQGLASGKVSLAEAKKNAKALMQAGALPQDGANPLAMGVDPDAAENPFSMQAGGGVADKASASEKLFAAAGQKNMQSKYEEDHSNKLVRSKNRSLYKSNEQARADSLRARGRYPEVTGYQQVFDDNGDPQLDKQGNPLYDQDAPTYNFENVTTDEQDPYVQQEHGIDRLEQLARLQGERDSKSNQMDWTPIMAFADFMNNGKTRLAQSALKPSGDNTMASAMEIQKRRGDLAKEATASEKNLKAGSTLDQLTQAMGLKDIAGMGGPGKGSTQQENAFLGRVTRDARDLRTQDGVLTNVSRLLSQWNPTADREIKTQIARLVEGTVRPQLAVIGASGGDTSFWQSMMNKLEEVGTGQMTAEQRGQYMRELVAMKRTHDEAANALRASWGVQNQRLQNPFSPEELQTLVGMATPGAGAAGAELRKIDAPKNVGKPKTLRTKPSNGPAVGTEEGGYVFQGGDPANPKNWKQK